MNNVSVMGGLGNQLFQYVFSRYLQSIGVKNVVLRKDFFSLLPSYRSDITRRDYLLDKYKVQYVMAEGDKTYKDWRDENNYRDDEAVSSDNIIYEGYWQDVRFYDRVSDDIKKELVLRPEYIDASMRSFEAEMAVCNSVALHIRRSDYLMQANLDIFEQLTMDYYSAAVSLIEEMTHEKPVLYIFSDDCEYVTEHMNNFMGCKTVIMPLREAYQDMYLMTKTKHNIIANSTFSWWGATLNCNSDNITVAPSNWMKGRKMNLYHGGWVVL